MSSDKDGPQDVTAATEICEAFKPATSDDLVPILQETQGAYGYLPAEIIAEVSRQAGLQASHTYGVATFYEQSHLEPHGRHRIKCCRGTACHVKGGRDIINSIRRELKVQPGETTEAVRFTFETEGIWLYGQSDGRR